MESGTNGKLFYRRRVENLEEDLGEDLEENPPGECSPHDAPSHLVNDERIGERIDRVQVNDIELQVEEIGKLFKSLNFNLIRKFNNKL